MIIFFLVLGHFNNYFACFHNDLYYLRFFGYRRLSTVMTKNVWIKLCQKIPLSLGKVQSKSESSLCCSYLPVDWTVDWLAMDENFFPHPLWLVSTALLLGPSFQCLNLVLSRFSLGTGLFWLRTWCCLHADESWLFWVEVTWKDWLVYSFSSLEHPITVAEENIPYNAHNFF